MSDFLILAYLFCVGSILGWCLEFIFRFLTNKEHRIGNPGLCVGPYLPIYGCGLVVLYLLAGLEKYAITDNNIINKLILFTLMAIAMTFIEYVAGIFCAKYLKVRLWDYSDRWGNIQGVICPLFSLFWAILGAFYYFVIHPHILDGLTWLANNLAFSFFIGLFFGIFIVDLINSTNLIMKLKGFAHENELELKYELIKDYIRDKNTQRVKKFKFFHSLQSISDLSDHLKEMYNIDIKKIRGRK